MWTQWIYVQETGKEREYMQLLPDEPYVPGPTLVQRKLLKSLPFY